jgi:hypothetical protein
MLFRNSDGSIIEINKSDFKNDYIYYTTLMKIKTNNKTEKTSQKIKTKTKVEVFFDIDIYKESNSDFTQEAKPNLYSKQSIDKLMNEFF